MKNRGFTLIELLVVVAIIGILAAVGVVAYSGYTSGAKKASAESNHKTVVKFIEANLMKCEMGTELILKYSYSKANGKLLILAMYVEIFLALQKCSHILYIILMHHLGVIHTD